MTSIKPLFHALYLTVKQTRTILCAQGVGVCLQKMQKNAYQSASRCC